MEKRKLDEILENHAKWLNGDGGKRADLREANLAGVNLEVAVLDKADLREANLSEANLRSAYLRSADLSGADLHGANLSGADLSGADLHGANLRSAYLRSAYLPTGVYQIVGTGSRNRCTTYDSINDRVICGCWNDDEGNHLDSFAKRIEEVYGAKGKSLTRDIMKNICQRLPFLRL